MSYYEFIAVDSTRRFVLHPDNRLTPAEKNIYVFRPEFVTVSELHVGSGMKSVEVEGNTVVITSLHYRNGYGKLAIPGSSFKGAVSTNFLALSGSSELTSNLFGATRKQAVISKVFFSDLVPAGNVMPVRVKVQRQWTPRKSKRGHVKVYVKKAPKTRDAGYLECIPKETIVGGSIIGYNLKPEEVGGILESMGYGFENAYFKIGFGKPQGFGQMRLINVEVNRVILDGLSLKERKVDENEIDEFRKKFESVCKRDLSSIARKLFARVV